MEVKVSVIHNGQCSVAVATKSTSAKAAKGVAIRPVKTAEIVQTQKNEWIAAVGAVVTVVV